MCSAHRTGGTKARAAGARLLRRRAPTAYPPHPGAPLHPDPVRHRPTGAEPAPSYRAPAARHRRPRQAGDLVARRCRAPRQEGLQAPGSVPPPTARGRVTIPPMPSSPHAARRALGWCRRRAPFPRRPRSGRGRPYPPRPLRVRASGSPRPHRPGTAASPGPGPGPARFGHPRSLVRPAARRPPRRRAVLGRWAALPSPAEPLRRVQIRARSQREHGAHPLCPAPSRAGRSRATARSHRSPLPGMLHNFFVSLPARSGSPRPLPRGPPPQRDPLLLH